MLLKIREKITGWIAAIFLGAIAVVFVFMGIDFQSAANTYAVKVNGEKVPVQTVQRAWQQQLSRLQQMLRDELPPDLPADRATLVVARACEPVQPPPHHAVIIGGAPAG